METQETGDIGARMEAPAELNVRGQSPPGQEMNDAPSSSSAHHGASPGLGISFPVQSEAGCY